jgi:predicted transcriptional regulator YheO
MTTSTETGGGAHRDEDAMLLSLLARITSTVGSALPSNVEIVLHDLAKIPNSIVAVSGDVTHRRIGDPATDVLLQAVVSGHTDTMVGYQTRLPDGRELRSSTMIVRNSADEQIAALCVNADVSAWLMMRDLVANVLQPLSTIAAPAAPVSPVPRPELPPAAEPAATPSERPAGPDGERFPRDVDELAAHLLSAAIADVGVPVATMKKEHKLQVVSQLRARGMFLLRDAVEMVAGHLQVSRFTIYNYLNELERDGDHVALDETKEH